MPFASDSFGNYLCFDYSKDGNHEVVFLNMIPTKYMLYVIV
ncbi:SMI1/KNR4 family protein [Paenibacillus sp. N3.4]